MDREMQKYSRGLTKWGKGRQEMCKWKEGKSKCERSGGKKGSNETVERKRRMEEMELKDKKALRLNACGRCKYEGNKVDEEG